MDVHELSIVLTSELTVSEVKFEENTIDPTSISTKHFSHQKEWLV